MRATGFQKENTIQATSAARAIFNSLSNASTARMPNFRNTPATNGHDDRLGHERMIALKPLLRPSRIITAPVTM